MDFELEFSRSGERYNVTNLDESRNRQLTPRSLSRKLLSFGRIYIAARMVWDVSRRNSNHRLWNVEGVLHLHSRILIFYTSRACTTPKLWNLAASNRQPYNHHVCRTHLASTIRLRRVILPPLLLSVFPFNMFVNLAMFTQALWPERMMTFWSVKYA